jgi:hypothetical protein
MGKIMKIKSVAFNLADPFEKKLFEHCQQFMVFSAHMKRLVQRDMEIDSQEGYNTRRNEGVDFDEKGFI